MKAANHNPFRINLSTAWLALCVSVAAIAFWAPLPGLQAVPVAPVETAQIRASTPAPTVDEASVETRSVLKRIDEVQAGDQVWVENPTEERDLEFGVAVTPETWRKLELSAQKADGTTCRVTLLRPEGWLESVEARVGGTVPISVPECGIDGDATVLSIDPCPPIETKSDRHRVVTGVFRHEAAQIIRLTIAGLSEPIETTANHPFWSEDRRDFVRADDLTENERLRSLDGSLAHLVESELLAEAKPVYNLEVHLDHMYHVASAGILVHNGSAKWCWWQTDAARVAPATKTVPNPGGRLGNAATRAKTQDVVSDLRARGFTEIEYEVRFRPGSLGSGRERFADVVGRNPITGETEIIQIGRTIKSDPRVPVIRERHALDDIIFSPDIQNFPNLTIRFVDVNRRGVIQP